MSSRNPPRNTAVLRHAPRTQDGKLPLHYTRPVATPQADLDELDDTTVFDASGALETKAAEEAKVAEEAKAAAVTEGQGDQGGIRAGTKAIMRSVSAPLYTAEIDHKGAKAAENEEDEPTAVADLQDTSALDMNPLSATDMVPMQAGTVDPAESEVRAHVQPIFEAPVPEAGAVGAVGSGVGTPMQAHQSRARSSPRSP